MVGRKKIGIGWSRVSGREAVESGDWFVVGSFFNRANKPVFSRLWVLVELHDEFLVMFIYLLLFFNSLFDYVILHENGRD